MRVYTRRNPDEKTRSKIQTNAPPWGSYGAPLKIHRRLQQRRHCCPFVVIERVLFAVSRFLSIDPSSISNPKLHAAARPEVMRFYESQSGLRALDLLRSAFLFMFQRQWLPHSTSKASRSNNVTVDSEARFERECECNNSTLQNSSKKPWILQETYVEI